MTKHGIKRALSATMALTIGATATLLPLTAFAAAGILSSDDATTPTTDNYVMTCFNNTDYIDMEFPGVNKSGQMIVHVGESPQFVINSGYFTNAEYNSRPANVAWHFGPTDSVDYCIANDYAWSLTSNYPGFSTTAAGFGSDKVGDKDYTTQANKEIKTTYSIGQLDTPGTYTMTLSYKYQMKSYEKKNSWSVSKSWITKFETNANLLTKDFTLIVEDHNYVKAATPKATTEATIDTASTATYDYTCSCGETYEQVETGSKVDTSALTSAINTVGGLTESAYTADSWAALTNAVTAANTTLGTGSSTKADVDGATEAINNAINALVPYRSYGFSSDDGTNATFTTPDAGDVTVDISAFRSLENIFDSIDMNKYVDKSGLESAKTAFDAVLTKSYRYTADEAQDKIQAELNSAISNLLFAITDANDESNLAKFSISVTINGDPDTAGLVTYPASVKYNESNTFNYAGTGIVKEWQVTSNGTTSKATNIDGNSMQYAVTGTATDKNVTINLVVETPVDENQIQLQGKNNKVFDATYIAPGADIKATGNVLQIGDTTVITAPVASSGSTLKYWTLEDGTKIEVGGEAVALTGTGTIIVTPHYFANPGYKMTVSGGKITDYNGLDHNSVYMTATNGTITGAYRQITTLTATDTSTFYAWAIKDGENYTIISYLPTYEFICEGSAEYKVITKAEAPEYKPTVRLRTATANADGLDEPGSKFGVFTGLVNGVDQICVFGQLVTNGVDTKYTVQDCGVIADTTGAGNTGVKIGDTGAKQMPASNRMDSGQFTITVKKNLASYAGFTVRGYVTYSYTYNGTTITVTDYTNGVVVR